MEVPVRSLCKTLRCTAECTDPESRGQRSGAKDEKGHQPTDLPGSGHVGHDESAGSSPQTMHGPGMRRSHAQQGSLQWAPAEA